MVIKKKIGEILVDSGLVSNSIVEKALQSKRPEQRIGDYLIEHGYVKEEVMILLDGTVIQHVHRPLILQQQ